MSYPDPRRKADHRSQTLPDLHANLTVLQTGVSLRRAKSEVSSRGGWRKRFSGNERKFSIKDAFGAVSRVAGAPLKASLYDPVGPAVTAASSTPTTASEPSNSARGTPRWIGILTPPSPTSEEPSLYTENVLSTGCVGAGPDQLATQCAPQEPSLSRTPSRLSTRIQKIPNPLIVPQRSEHSHIIAINPDHTQVIEPGNTPSSSPTTITPSAETHRQSTVDDIQGPAHLNEIAEGLSRLDTLISSYHSASRQQTQSSVNTYTTAPQQCERKMMIIGSSYDHDAGRTSTRLSSVSGWGPLPAMQNDVNDLESTFRTQGYHVETRTREHFQRQEVLDDVARFLGDALPGDVRAIVFTGHSDRIDTGSPAMILPGTASDVVITAHDWNQNIRTKARPGVIVLLILATCFAGAFAEQSVRITDFAHPREVEDFASLNAPILVTFSSSGSQERSYESPLGDYERQDRDHFLWALARTAQNPKARTWQEFVTMLRDAFAFARVTGSAGAEEGALEWMWENPQYPVFATTVPGYLPALRTIFPAALEGLVQS